MKPIRCFAFAALCALSAPAMAETLWVSGIYPADSDAAAAVRVLAVEQFGGESGPDLSFRIEDALRGAVLQGEPWLRVVPYGPDGSVQAVLRGTSAIEERVQNYTEEHERCIKDGDGKCTPAKEKYQARCKRRTIELLPRMRLLGPDGTLLWSDNSMESLTDSWCDDSTTAPRQRGAIVRELADRVARRIVGDFVPRALRDEVRVDESRKGLNKSDSDRFKAAVRKVKDRDAPGACADWGTLAQANPAHLPSLFNLGLCAESAGDDAAAQGHYRQVLAIDPRNDKALGRLDRIAARERARRQIQAHTAA